MTPSNVPPGELQTLELIGVGPASHLTVELAARLSLLAGDNGVGKTFLLDVLWWCLTGTWTGLSAWPSLDAREREPTLRITDSAGHVASSVYDRTHERWHRPASWPTPEAPVLYVRLDGQFSLWDPVRNRGIDAPAVYHLDSAWDRLVDDHTNMVLCNGLVDDWRDWAQRDDKTLFERFFRVVRALMPPEDDPRPGGFVKLSKYSASRIPQLHLRYGDVPIVHLSAGMKRILGIAYLLVWAWDEHVQAARLEGAPPARQMVLLIDEVEAHLHPQWQRMLLPALLEAAEGLAESRLAVRIVANTHSPLVTASLEPIFDPDRDRLLHLGYVGNEVRIEELPWANHGDATAWLESPAFELGRATSVELERALAAADAYLAKQPLPPGPLDSREKIDRELRRLLPSMDPFWLQWGPPLDLDEASQ